MCQKEPDARSAPARKSRDEETDTEKGDKGADIQRDVYLQRTGAAGGQLKLMIRLGERAIERMEGTYENAKPPKRGHER